MNQACLASGTVRLSSGQLECAERPWPPQSCCGRPLNLFPLPLPFCPIYSPPDRHSGRASIGREHTVTVGFALGSCLPSNKDTFVTERENTVVRGNRSSSILLCTLYVVHFYAVLTTFVCVVHSVAVVMGNIWEPGILGKQLHQFVLPSPSLSFSLWKKMDSVLAERTFLKVVGIAACFRPLFPRCASSHFSGVCVAP